MIAFNTPFISGEENACVQEAISGNALASDGPFTRKCEQWLQQFTGAQRALLTPSCTHALEMCALLCDIQPGDEIITTSFNFVSAANAFVLRGAKIIFVDICPTTMNMDEQQLEKAISQKTKAVVVMHYGGVGCAMDDIISVVRKHKLWLIEDAAHGLGAFYKGEHLGAIGHLGVISFHYTKNIHCGEGGALLINDPSLVERAEIIREKGTDRKRFQRGETSKYTWVDIGSSYIMSELNAAFLWAQLQKTDEVKTKRKKLWHSYHQALSEIPSLELPSIPTQCDHNGHIYFIRVLQERFKIQEQLKNRKIETAFHYIPLHLSSAGQRWGCFCGEDRFTTSASEQLLRLPLYPALKEGDVHQICEEIEQIMRRKG